MNKLVDYKRLGAIATQNLYISAHPVVFWLCVGLAAEGFIGAFFPQLLLASATSQALPDWLSHLFYGVYMVGGCASVVAQLRAKAWLESVGMMLLATGFFVQFLSVVYLLHGYFWQGLFLLTLAVGAQQRSVFVAEFGYPVRVINDGNGDDHITGRLDAGD